MISSYFKRVNNLDFSLFELWLDSEYDAQITDFSEDIQVRLFEQWLTGSFVPLEV